MNESLGSRRGSTSLEEAVATLRSARSARSETSPLRVYVDVEGGGTIRGELREVSVGELEILDAGKTAAVRFAGIETIYVATPRPARHLLLLVVAILSGTGALLVYSLLPGVEIESTDWPGVFGSVSLIGGTVWALLARSERFQRWWCRWVLLYSRDPP